METARSESKTSEQKQEQYQGATLRYHSSSATLNQEQLVHVPQIIQNHRREPNTPQN